MNFREYYAFPHLVFCAKSINIESLKPILLGFIVVYSMMKKILSLSFVLLVLTPFIDISAEAACSAKVEPKRAISLISNCWADSVSAPNDTIDVPRFPHRAQIDTLELATPHDATIAENALERGQRLMRERLETLLSDPLLSYSQLGLCVYDLTEDKMLFQSGLKQRLRPASSLKVITAICAIDVLGGNFYFKTEMRSSTPLTADTLKANLYIKGVMDPLLDKDNVENFVRVLSDNEVTCWNGDLVLDRSYKDTLAAGWGWCWDDENPLLTPLLCEEKDNFAEVFAQKLLEKNIHWEGQVLEGTAPSDALVLSTQKHSLDQVLKPAMKKSCNLSAEALFYSIAAAEGEKYAGRKEAQEQICKIIRNKLNLDPKDTEIVDGSGLSLYNFVTPELLIAFMRYAYQNKDIYRHLKPTLPVMGVDGTLRRRCKGENPQNKVFAKTGSMTSISSLTGYAQGANGHMYAFVIINQGVKSAKEGRDFQDKVCKALTRKY